MNVAWKKYLLIAANSLLAVYLVLAVSAFNTPDNGSQTCRKVLINIDNGVVRGFLDAAAVKNQLQRAKIYPEGDAMDAVSVRRIEDTLENNPLIENAECYKTMGGGVVINITQRLPVLRVMSDNGENYYIDAKGDLLPSNQYASDLAVATGHIDRKYARRVLAGIGSLILSDNFWRSQTEQLNVRDDGSLELVPRVGSHIVCLGQPVDVKRKLERLRKFYRYGLSQAGWNKYSVINVEFENQIICKRR